MTIPECTFQVGLAAEYLGRYFTSIDGLSYHEIVDRPEIEVVSVDPRCDFLPFSTEKKRNNKAKTNRGSTNVKNMKTSFLSLSEKRKSFETCMHESFHCVLGYCSQVVTPGYKTNVEGKIMKLNENKNLFNVAKGMEKQTSATNVVTQSAKYEAPVNFKNNLQKPVEGSKLLDNYTVTMMSQNVKNYSNMSKTRLFPTQKVYVANSQKSIAFSNLKTLQGGQMKLHQVVRSPNNSSILVNPSETKSTKILKPVSSNVKTIKLEDMSAKDKSSTDASLMYKNIIPINELTGNSKGMTLKQTPMKRGNKMEVTVTKYLLDNAQQNKIKIANETNTGEKKLCYEVPSREVSVKMMSGCLNKTWCANDTSQIAKILSEYNKSSTKKSAIENSGFYTSVKSIGTKDVNNKEENRKQNTPENSSNRNMNIKFPQGKWRRFHLTVEKLKNIKGSTSEKKLQSSVQNRQSLFKIDQTIVDITADKTTEVPKCLETFQRIQPNVMNPEKKENTSMNNSADAVTMKTQSLQELLENTAMLYCAATGTHQDDLANYIDSLDAAQSIQWLEACKNLVV